MGVAAAIPARSMRLNAGATKPTRRERVRSFYSNIIKMERTKPTRRERVRIFYSNIIKMERVCIFYSNSDNKKEWREYAFFIVTYSILNEITNEVIFKMHSFVS
jgi:hypothetical protein